MLRKIIKQLLGSKTTGNRPYGHYGHGKHSSSDGYKKYGSRPPGHHNQYGSGYYKRKKKSSGFFSS